MAYQPPSQPQDPRASAFAQAANRFFASIDGYVRTECGRLQSQPALSARDIVNLGNGLETYRQTAYTRFLTEVRTNARLASAVVDKNAELKAVFGGEPTGYARQALAHYRLLLELRVFRTATIEAARRGNPVEMWSVLEQYANTYNARNRENPIHTRVSPRGQTYDIHFGRQNPELDYFQLLPILDREIRTASPQDQHLAQVNPKAFLLLGQEIVKRTDAIVAHDAQTTAQRLGAIKQDAFARVAKSRRATTIFQMKPVDLEELMRLSASSDE